MTNKGDYYKSAQDDITDSEFDDMLEKISTKTAPGISLISGAMIKHAAEFHDLILNCFRIFYRDGGVPDSWKKSLTILAYKKDDPNDFNNYRPIALLECLYKAYSTIILGKLNKHIYEDNKIINDNQFGFKPGCSIANQYGCCNQ